MSRKIFIDGGARQGEALDIFLDRRPDFFTNCDMYLFEPQRAHQRVLQELAERRPCYTQMMPVALWIENTTLDFFICTDVWGDSGSTLFAHKLCQLDRENPQLVEAIDTALFLTEHVRPRDYVILKLDIEGAEYHVVPHLIETGAITLINELYIEWHDDSFQGTDTDIDTPKRSLLEAACDLDLIIHEWEF